MPAFNPEEIHALMADAFNQGDLEAFLALHEEDAVTIVPIDGRRAAGRDQIRRAVEPVFALKPRMHNEVLGKVEGDGVALTQARWRLAGEGPDGERVEMNGQGVVVSRRQSDGTWLVVLESPVM